MRLWEVRSRSKGSRGINGLTHPSTLPLLIAQLIVIDLTASQVLCNSNSSLFPAAAHVAVKAVVTAGICLVNVGTADDSLSGGSAGRMTE